MLSADTNLFIHAANPDAEENSAAVGFFNATQSEEAPFFLCELILVEVYMQLRNPKILERPYSAEEAADYCDALRGNPRWAIIDYVPEISPALWRWARRSRGGIRQIIDARIALTLRHHGVKEFATANLKHFQGFGFERVWNPLTS